MDTLGGIGGIDAYRHDGSLMTMDIATPMPSNKTLRGCIAHRTGYRVAGLLFSGGGGRA